jgi:AAA family ATP:ADP antiporter
MTDPTRGGSSPMQRRIAGVEHHEIKVALAAFVYFFILMASYFILRPLRDTMGTIYGVAHLQELFTGTFLLSLRVAPTFAGLASCIRLASFPRGSTALSPSR